MSLVRPAFPVSFRVHVLGEEGVVLRSERSQKFLPGPLYGRIASLVDGDRTIASIVTELCASFEPELIHFAIANLERNGLLVDAEHLGTATDAVFWDAIGVPAKLAMSRIGSEAIRIESHDLDLARIARQAFEAAGLTIGEDGPTRLVLVHDYLDPDLARVNRSALDGGWPWLLVKPVGQQIFIGPLFTSRSACWSCLAHRLRIRRPIDAILERRKAEIPGPPSLATSSTVRMAIELAANEMMRWIGGGDSERLTNVVVSFDVLGLAMARHRFVRRPQCSACGDPKLYSRNASRPVTIRSSRPAVWTDGGLRSMKADEFLDRNAHLVDPVTGLVPELRELRVERAQMIRLVTAGLNPALGLAGIATFRRELHNQNAGKGRTGTQCRASALGEAIERYSAMFHGDEPRIRSTFDALGSRALDPNDCMLFSDRQLDRRTDSMHTIHAVPARLDPTVELDWTGMWSLTRRRHVYLPTHYLYAGHPDAGSCAPGRFDSNGTAAGTSIEDALLHALLELIERDAVAIWWYNRLRRPAPVVDGPGAACYRDLEADYAATGRELWMLDLTHDLGIPVFAAISRRSGSGDQGIVLGFGADPDPALATSRALCELNQVVAALEQFRGDRSSFPSPVRAWLQDARVDDHDYLLPSGTSSWQIGPESAHPDCASAVSCCIRAIEAHGIEVLVLDQTRPDIDAAAVKVVAPGLRHFWPRHAPGRLYSVPVAMGWLDRPRAEHELNPVPILL